MVGNVASKAQTEGCLYYSLFSVLFLLFSVGRLLDQSPECFLINPVCVNFSN